MDAGANSSLELTLGELLRSIKWSQEKLELLDAAQDVSPDEALEYGPKIIFERIWSNLGLDKIIIASANK